MPFCPKCKAEYEVGVAKCSDCLIPLVSRLPEKKNNEFSESELVYLCTVPNEIEAILIADLLKQSNIESSYHTSMLSGQLSSIFQQTSKDQWNEIFVLDIDYDSAKEIVDDYLKSIEEKQKPEDNREKD